LQLAVKSVLPSARADSVFIWQLTRSSNKQQSTFVAYAHIMLLINVSRNSPDWGPSPHIYLGNNALPEGDQGKITKAAADLGTQGSSKDAVHLVRRQNSSANFKSGRDLAVRVGAEGVGKMSRRRRYKDVTIQIRWAGTKVVRSVFVRVYDLSLVVLRQSYCGCFLALPPQRSWNGINSIC
jgi:hypothetical protein